jgi:hypothetical protein
VVRILVLTENTGLGIERFEPLEFLKLRRYADVKMLTNKTQMNSTGITRNH